MRRFFTLVLGLVFAVSLVACDSNDNDTPTAEVRFMHASPDIGAVTIVADGEELQSGVSYSSTTTSPAVTDYFDVPVATDAEIAVQSGGSTILSTTAGDANLQEGNQYTVIVAGAQAATQATGTAAPQPIVLRDQFRDLGDGEVGIRIVHGSAFAGPVDVYLTSPGTSLGDANPLTSSFTFTDAFPTGFKGQFAPQPVSASGSVFTVTPPGDTTAVLQLPVGTGGTGSLPVSTGQYITGVAVDNPSTSPPSAGALVHVDQQNPLTQ
jgi:hypothetical protein